MKHEEIYRTQTGKDATGLDRNGIEFYYDNYLKWLKKQLSIPVVSVPKGTLSDFEKWLDKKENESYCGLPSQYVLDKYKSLNAL